MFIPSELDYDLMGSFSLSTMCVKIRAKVLTPVYYFGSGQPLNIN